MAEEAGAIPTAPDDRRLAFQAYWPRTAQPGIWHDLLVYVIAGAAGTLPALEDAVRRLQAAAVPFVSGAGRADRIVTRGVQLTVCPELPGFRCEPPLINLTLDADWHSAVFRVQALAGATLGDEVSGRVVFYVGPILIGEVAMTVRIDADADAADDADRWQQVEADSYRRIFVSYSHEDSTIVDRLEAAYRALGDDYLRDIRMLRSGEVWSEALEGKIEEADVFQLCWSNPARQSEFVTREWRYALDLKRPRFIRPVYWDQPMPAIPGDLGHLHFAYLPGACDDKVDEAGA